MNAAVILVVDDDPPVREVVAESLTSFGYRVVTAGSAEAALTILERIKADVVLSDIHMPGMNGVELCATLKRDPRFQLVPVVLLTAASDLDARIAGLAAGADDFFTKPCELTELRARVGALVRMKAVLDQLERAEGIITTLALTIERRDPFTAGHCERLARTAVAVGEALSVEPRMLRVLRVGGFLHDLGKIAVPDRVLLKAGALDDAERAAIRTHATVGAELVQGMKTLDDVRPIIRHHHERWDGSGYPDALEGEAIPFGARIMAVVDVYDALVSERPYKPPYEHDHAVGVLQRETDAGAFDPAVVTAFLEVLRHRRR